MVSLSLSLIFFFFWPGKRSKSNPDICFLVSYFHLLNQPLIYTWQGITLSLSDRDHLSKIFKIKEKNNLKMLFVIPRLTHVPCDIFYCISICLITGLILCLWISQLNLMGWNKRIQQARGWLWCLDNFSYVPIHWITVAK